MNRSDHLGAYEDIVYSRNLNLLWEKESLFERCGVSIEVVEDLEFISIAVGKSEGKWTFLLRDMFLRTKCRIGEVDEILVRGVVGGIHNG